MYNQQDKKMVDKNIRLIDNINFKLRTRFNSDFHYEIQDTKIRNTKKGKSFVKVSEKEQEIYVSQCTPSEMLTLLTILSAVIDDL